MVFTTDLACFGDRVTWPDYRWVLPDVAGTPGVLMLSALRGHATRRVLDSRLAEWTISFIEGWYNPVRLHSSLGYLSPMAYETATEVAQAQV